jgi:hypothetical protein
MATLDPWLRTSAARSRLPGSGTERAPRKVAAVAGGRAGPTVGQGSASAAATWRSLGKLRWLTVRWARQVRMARSTRDGIETGVVISTLCSATSMNSRSRWTSCWWPVPSTVVSCMPVMASTGAWSSLAS